MQVDVSGAQGIALVAKRVRQLGSDRTIINNLTKRIRTGIAPIARPAVRASALATLPAAGGLGAWVARVRVLVQVRRGAQTAGVTISAGRNSAGGRSDIRAIDAGGVRHQTFGHRPWVTQSVPAGFFSQAIDETAVLAFREMTVAAVDESVRALL